MDAVREVLHSFFVIDSIWSVVFRAGIWFLIATVIIVSTDVANPEKSIKRLKSNLGFFLMFVVLSSVLIFMLFGYTATPAVAPV